MNKKPWVRHAAVAIYVLTVTCLAGKWAIRAAYLERGYAAIGGEYFFIPMAAWASYKVINIFFAVWEERDDTDGECNKEESGEVAEMRHHE